MASGRGFSFLYFVIFFLREGATQGCTLFFSDKGRQSAVCRAVAELLVDHPVVKIKAFQTATNRAADNPQARMRLKPFPDQSSARSFCLVVLPAGAKRGLGSV